MLAGELLVVREVLLLANISASMLAKHLLLAVIELSTIGAHHKFLLLKTGIILSLSHVMVIFGNGVSQDVILFGHGHHLLLSHV